MTLDWPLWMLAGLVLLVVRSASGAGQRERPAMKYATKRELLEDMQDEFRALIDLLERIPEDRFADPGVWGDDWSINDLLAHLAEWHRLFLGWYRAGSAGETPSLPAPGYKWNETPKLNREIWRRHRGRPTAELRRELDATHAEVLQLATRLSPDELLGPGRFPWTGENALVTYLGANTASHYRFAMKVLNRWPRRTSEREPV